MNACPLFSGLALLQMLAAPLFAAPVWESHHAATLNDFGPLAAMGDRLLYLDGSAAFTTDGVSGSIPLGRIPFSGLVHNFITTPSRCYLQVIDNQYGWEIYALDGTPGGFTRVFSGAYVQSFFNIGDRVYFPAWMNSSAETSWYSGWTADGTLNGTSSLSPYAGSGVTGFGTSASFVPLGVAGSDFYYLTESRTANPPPAPVLWRSRGAPPAVLAGQPDSEAGAVLVYARDMRDGAGSEPWRTDGTAAGTYRLADINPGAGGSEATIVPVGPLWWFTASDGGEIALWRTDGTAAGTVKVVPLTTAGPIVTLLAVMGDKAFYHISLYPGQYGALWFTDGTPAGTAKAASLDAMPANRWTVWQDRFWFSGYTPESGGELWATDGTAAGTAMVEDLAPGTASSTPYGHTAAGGRLYYAVRLTYPGKPVLRAMESITGTTYAAWAGAHGLAGEASLPGSILAGDGISNLLKYAFNLNPLATDARMLAPDGTAGMPSVSYDAGTVQVRYLRRLGVPLNYLLESSSDMQSWQPVTQTPEDASTGAGSEWERCTVPIPATAAKHYFRVRVSSN